jgi:hypothetical protein
MPFAPTDRAPYDAALHQAQGGSFHAHRSSPRLRGRRERRVNRPTPADAPTRSLIRAVISAREATGPSGAERLADDVILLVVHDGSGRLIDFSGDVFAVTETGAMMLELALRDGSEAACRILAARYRLDAAQVRADMEGLFGTLRERHLLVPATSARGRRQVRPRLSWLVGALVKACVRLPASWMTTKAWLLISLAFGATRLFGWSHTIDAWDHAISPKSPIGDPSPRVLSAMGLAVSRALACHPLPVACKERALAAWALARAGGIPAEIVLGVDLFPFGLHCWCAHGAFILADRYEGRCDRYTPLLVYR